MRHLTLPIITLVVGSLLSAQPNAIEEFAGKVIGVTDGDTIKVLVDKMPRVVRLEGIDAPEAKQSFGNKSKQALSKLVVGKTVRVLVTGTDKYKRTLGKVEIEGVDVNAQMIEDGWAWHYKKYNSEMRLSKLEEQAKTAKKGLWAEENPLPPWEFRARQKTGGIAEAATEPPAESSPAGFWLNTSSGVRHNSRCEHYRNTKRGRECGPDEGKPCGICGG
jgi:endonuclease YncB( thermonuclease family)